MMLVNDDDRNAKWVLTQTDIASRLVPPYGLSAVAGCATMPVGAPTLMYRTWQ